MSRPCTVCRSLERADIDIALARPTTTNVEIARRLGCSEAAVRNHRTQHLAPMLKIYGAKVVLPDVGTLHAEYLRLYASALENLAEAQAGTLIDVGDDGTPHRRKSATSISRAISEARKCVDAIVALAADGASEDERPIGLAQGELTARVSAQLQRILAASQTTEARAIEATSDAEGIEVSVGPTATVGGHAADGGHDPTSEIPQDSATPFSSVGGISDSVKAVLKANERSTQTAQSLDDTPLIHVPHPGFPGSPAATQEERSAMGYPDVVITLEDVKANQDIVARALAAHREGVNPQPPTA